MDLQQVYREYSAVVASDGIPLHFGDLAKEYRAALEQAVLLDRSHEGRLELAGRDQLNLIHRISTNDVAHLQEGEGKPTLFVNPNARILDRITLYRRGDKTVAIAEPGRGSAVAAYLQRNIFFNDDMQIRDITGETRQFALHGASADSVMTRIAPDLVNLPALHSQNIAIDDIQVFAARNKPLVGSHWTLIVSVNDAAGLWQKLVETGAAEGLLPAGSLTYNSLRIRAGRPGVGRELSLDYIPLEVGLFDEISFSKGCYTGQEIIARMESRSRIAKVMVRLVCANPVEAPAEVYDGERVVGRLTSSVHAPDGVTYGIAIIKTDAATPDAALTVGEARVNTRVIDLAGAVPPMIAG